MESFWSQEKAVQEVQIKCQDVEEKMAQFASKLPMFKAQGSCNVTMQWRPNACSGKHMKIASWPSWKHRLDQDRWNLERSLPQHPRAVQI